MYDPQFDQILISLIMCFQVLPVLLLKQKFLVSWTQFSDVIENKYRNLFHY